MIRSITIKGYRGLEHLEMSNLGRINLLVGKNNSGKSSVLEALYLLGSKCSPEALLDVLWPRGEFADQTTPSPGPTFDVRHLFYGHRLEREKAIFIAAKEYNDQKYEVNINIEELDTGDKTGKLTPQNSLSAIFGKNADEKRQYALDFRGGIPVVIIQNASIFGHMNSNRRNFTYLPLGSMTPQKLVSVWDGSVVLTSQEENVMRALRHVDPRIQRIASIQGNFSFRAGEPLHAGFAVRLESSPEPVPIGSLGDGVWYMLAIATSLAVSQDGVLLIDEIDTGLHYSVMADLWRMIAKTAKELNVQVFATTHSYDCITSLARICRDDPGNENEVTIQRIEAGKTRSVAYDEGDIRVAAERHIEMR